MKLPHQIRIAPLGLSLVLLLASVILLAVSCKPTSSSTSGEDSTATVAGQQPMVMDLNKVVPGKWISTWLHVEIATFQGTPMERVVDVREDSWEETFKRTPLETYYQPDHTFYWEYTEADTLVKGPVGTWMAQGDSLFHQDSSYSANNFHYKIIMHGDSVMEMRTMVDWDFDGLLDDKYYGHLRRAKEGE